MLVAPVVKQMRLGVDGVGDYFVGFAFVHQNFGRDLARCLQPQVQPSQEWPHDIHGRERSVEGGGVEREGAKRAPAPE